MTTTPEAAELKPCREAFETWWSPLYDRSLERDGDGYSLMQTQLAWDAWKNSWKNSWNTRASTPPAAPADDAVEALADALPTTHENTNWKELAEDMLIILAAKGYTLRRETMTEAELAEEALDISIGNRVGGRSHKHIIDLAKKYRG